MRLGPLETFLEPPDQKDGGSTLVVLSGVPRHLPGVLDAVQARYPRGSVAVLARTAVLGELPPRPGVEYVEARGGAADVLRRLRDRSFDRVLVLLTGEPGYWKLKTLAVAIGAPALYAVDERMGWFRIGIRHAPLLAQHLRGRLESSVGLPLGGSSLLEALMKASVYPPLLAYLLAYERYHTLRARLRGAASWKQENRPTPPRRVSVRGVHVRPVRPDDAHGGADPGAPDRPVAAGTRAALGEDR